jgi:flagellar protein FliS
MNIIQGLRTSLDAEKGGDIAANLDSLYEYMGRRLLEANMNNDTAILDEVNTLLSEIKLGWDGIPAEFH